MDSSERRKFVFTLGFLQAIGSFSIDTYLPGFPAIAEDLNTDIEHVALSLTSYFIGISLGQLLYGPILDRYGRKKPLITGLLIYIAAAAGCALAPSIHALIALRFFLAIGGCVGMVGSRAVVKDLFSVHETAKIFSMMMLVMGVAPIVAPLLGGAIVTSLGWRFIFVFLVAVAGIMLFVVAKNLPETKEKDLSVSLNPLKITAKYFSLFRNRTFLVYTIACGSASAALFTYISDSPFVFIQLFGISESMFGWFFGLNAMALISASQINRFLLSKRSSRQVTIFTIVLQVCCGLILTAMVVLQVNHILIMILIFIYLFWLGFLNPNTSALALEPFKKNVGTASAMLGSFQMIFGAAASALVSLFHDGTPLPMAALLLGFSVLGMGAILYERYTNVKSQLSANDKEAQGRALINDKISHISGE